MYDDANSSIRREAKTGLITGIASTMFARFLYFQKTRVKKVHALVTTAGTNAVAGFDILNGTTSVGEIVVGTNTAGSIVSSGLLNTDIAALGFLEFKGKATSATMVLSCVIEEQVLPEAVQS